MEASDAIEYLGKGIEGRGEECLAGVFAAIADKAGMPIKSMRLTFREGPMARGEFKFPKLGGEKGS